MLSLAGNYRYFLFNGAADMRKSFDGLSGLVRSVLLCDPLSGDIFIFLNARRNQIKLLAWEQDGFAVYHKRLERGTFELPDASCQGTSIHLSKDNGGHPSFQRTVQNPVFAQKERIKKGL